MSLSSRAQHTLAVPSCASSTSAESRLTALQQSAWRHPYDAATNPSGVINLSIAENILSVPSIASRLRTAPPPPASLLSYSDSHGTPSFRRTLAAFLQARLSRRRPVRADGLVVLPGAGAVLDALAHALFDEGDAALVFTPFYPGFQFALWARARVRIVSVPLQLDGDVDESSADGVHPFNLSVLDNAYRNAVASGITVRALLLCSPHNPTGTLLPFKTLSTIVSWTLQNNLHLISDELYALSIHTPPSSSSSSSSTSTTSTFTPITAVTTNPLPPTIHQIYSFSKDFCLAGFRLAVLHSTNQQLLSHLRHTTSHFSSPSTLVQHTVSHLLSDSTWLSTYLSENTTRLAKAYANCTRNLTTLHIPYLPAAAGFFLWIDLRSHLSTPTQDAELSLCIAMASNGVLLTPGHKCLSSTPGFFRLCFAAVNPETLNTAFKRLAPILNNPPS